MKMEERIEVEQLRSAQLSIESLLKQFPYRIIKFNNKFIISTKQNRKENAQTLQLTTTVKKAGLECQKRTAISNNFIDELRMYGVVRKTFKNATRPENIIEIGTNYQKVVPSCDIMNTSL